MYVELSISRETSVYYNKNNILVNEDVLCKDEILSCDGIIKW